MIRFIIDIFLYFHKQRSYRNNILGVQWWCRHIPTDIPPVLKIVVYRVWVCVHACTRVRICTCVFVNYIIIWKKKKTIVHSGISSSDHSLSNKEGAISNFVYGNISQTRFIDVSKVVDRTRCHRHCGLVDTFGSRPRSSTCSFPRPPAFVDTGARYIVGQTPFVDSATVSDCLLYTHRCLVVM